MLDSRRHSAPDAAAANFPKSTKYYDDYIVRMEVVIKFRAYEKYPMGRAWAMRKNYWRRDAKLRES